MFGGSIASVPDVNNDGHPEVVVGACDEYDNPAGAGRAYLYNGANFNGATSAPLETLVSPSKQADGYFGRSVAGINDVNGDRKGDVLVGAPWENPDKNHAKAGQAYIMSGSTSLMIRLFSSPNKVAGGQFGDAIASVGDLNGDRIDDVVIGAPMEPGTNGAQNAGRVYVYSGKTGTLLYALASPNQAASGLFGSSVTGVQDADYDGYGDIVVGAPGENPVSDPYGSNPKNFGCVYVFSGKTGKYLRTLHQLHEDDGESFGCAVAGIPNVMGPGTSGVVVGAYMHQGTLESLPNAGRIYIFNAANGNILNELCSPNQTASGYFGFSVAGTPDMDWDKRGEVLVGAPGENKAYVFDGWSGQLLATYSSLTMANNGSFGYSVAGLSDVNGDRRGDVAVGSIFENMSGPVMGSAYVFPGPDLRTNARDWLCYE